MARRSTSMLDDLMDIAAMLPWWAGTLLAIASYFFFHGLYAGHFSLTGDNQFAGTIVKTFSMGFQYIFPMAIGAGALVSGVNQIKKKRIFNKQTSIKTVRDLSWQAFELLISEAYRRQGFDVTETDTGPDGGIDIVLRKDGRKIYVQCKHWKSWKVGVDKVRELNGVVAAKGAYSGILVTSGVFTTEAITFAETCPIELIDGDKLGKLIPEIEPAKAAAQIQSEVTPSCPKCGSIMRKRTAKKGPSVGNSFWGCSTYPKCKATMNIA